VRQTGAAVVVKAEVVARNSATGEKRTATSDGSGDFTLLSLARQLSSDNIRVRIFGRAILKSADIQID